MLLRFSAKTALASQQRVDNQIGDLIMFIFNRCRYKLRDPALGQTGWISGILSYNFLSLAIIAQLYLPPIPQLPPISKTSEQNVPSTSSSVPITGDFDYYFSLCRVVWKQQKYEEALSACNEAINRTKKKVAGLWAIRSDILYNLKYYEEALVSSLKALEMQGKNSPALTQKCRALSALGQQDEAIIACDAALEINQNWDEFSPALTWLSRGLAWERKEQYAEALASFEEALTIQPQYSFALVSQARILAQMGKYEEAIARCDRALNVNENWGESSPEQAWLLQGVAFSRWSKPEQVLVNCPSEETASDQIILDPNQCLKTTRTSRLEAAVNSYQKATQLNPKFAAPWLYQGMSLNELNRYELARNTLETGLKIEPNSRLGLVSLCTTLNKLGNYQEALTACENALQTNSNSEETDLTIDALMQKGQALAGLKRYEEALEAIDGALSLKPDWAIAWNAKSVIFWQEQNYQEALKANDRALAADPNYFQAHFNRGSIFRAMQQNQQAIAAYDQALDSDVNFVSEATLASVWANRSAALWDLGQYQEAIAAANRAIALDPNLVSAWFNRGLSLDAVNDYEAAINSYQQALRLDPKQVNIWVAQGMAFFHLKRYPEALNAFEEALKIDPNYLPAKQNRDLLTQKETGVLRQEAGDSRHEAGDSRQETGVLRQEAGDSRHEAGDRR